jgi:hypothetical protein
MMVPPPTADPTLRPALRQGLQNQLLPHTQAQPTTPPGRSRFPTGPSGGDYSSRFELDPDDNCAGARCTASATTGWVANSFAKVSARMHRIRPVLSSKSRS